MGTARTLKTAIGVTTDFGAGSADPKVVPAEPRPDRSPSASAAEPYRELIESGLARGRNAMAIWQDLVDQHGFTAGYQSVKRFLQKLRGAVKPEARAVIKTPPGKHYGTLP
jgi:transposase